jgi:hypothetical protein
MNDLNAEDELITRLPVRLRGKVAWTFPRVHWQHVEIAFFTDTPGLVKIVEIPYEHWLDDWAIAKICLEAP